MKSFKELILEVKNYAAAKRRGERAAKKGRHKKKLNAKKMKSASDFKKQVKNRVRTGAENALLKKTGDPKKSGPALSKWRSQNKKKIDKIMPKVMKKMFGSAKDMTLAAKKLAKAHNDKIKNKE
jgi:hypothetical protein